MRLKNAKLKLDKVIKWETQVASSVNYRLMLAVEEEVTSTKQYSIVVEEDKKKHLKSFKHVA
ncbi:hypothetical protein Tsubulata_008031 [Turnera subulata]|uniref:Cystatin domain-containing protein n=1 Tax=Turnera subulata TaxID=218843 RepID=A0A9Q0JCL9_9ROSI|nr:hypothetical protein Tsubulata_008031 [Turnera subulata]